MADKIEELNNKRRELTQEVYESCLNQVKMNNWQRSNTLVLYDPDFHEGVLGLVANKIATTLHKPTLVLTKNDQGEVKGSGRSGKNFNLFNALNPLKKLFTKFGGHDFACGLSMNEDKIPELREKLESGFHVEQESAEEYDFELNLKDLSLDTLEQINQAGPFGTDNPKPVFSVSDFQIKNFIRMGQEKNHIRFNAVKDDGSLTVVGFNKDYLDNDLLPFISKVFVELNRNTYKNKVSLQAIMKGVDFAAPKLAVPAPIIDLRNESYVMGFADRYLLFNEKNIPAVENLGIDPEKITLVKDYDQADEVVVLLDTPKNKIELDQALQNNYQQLYLRFLLDQLPVEKLPAKSYFGKVLKYIYAHPTLKPQDYQAVAPYLGLDYDSVLFILRVFFELGFVKLDDDKLVGVKHPQKKPLSQSKYLLATNSQIKFVNELRHMSTTTLLNYIDQLRN